MDVNSTQCQKKRIAAYLDGVLKEDASRTFEEHLHKCRSCTEELNEQRQFILTLDSTLTASPDLPLPKNFIQVVAARAESDLSGVRNRLEHKRAARLCALLAMASAGLVGVAALKAVVLSGQVIAHQVLVVFELIWNAFRDAAIGLTVVSRVIGGGLIPEPHFAGLAALLLALAIVLLSLLIGGYHRRSEMRPF